MTNVISFRWLKRELNAHTNEAVDAFQHGDELAESWLRSNFPGNVFHIESLRAPKPPTLEQQKEVSQIRIESLLRRLGEEQSRLSEINLALQVERRAPLTEMIVASRQKWEIEQAKLQAEAQAERFVETQKAEAERQQRAKEYEARVAAEHQQRALRDAANMEAKRRELVPYLPS